MDPAFRTVIGPAFVEVSKEVAGKYPLYIHQVELASDNSNVVILDAPTGSGKTLAALKRILDRSSPAIFVYPTNSLVKNQAEAIIDLLRGLGHSPNLIDHESSVDEIHEGIQDTDIDVIHLTGESLEMLAEEEAGAKGSLIDAILTGTQHEGRLRILLTNPDTIYIAFINRYYRAGRIFEQLDTFKTLVLDEFHLYSGPLLARIMFMVNVLAGNRDAPSFDLVFLSATHGDTMDLLKSTYQGLRIIKAPPLGEKPQNGRQIRYLTECRVRSISRVMTNASHVDEAADEILNLYDSEYTGAVSAVKVLGIFSSVSFAVRVAKKVKEMLLDRGADESIVYQLHGFIPRQARSFDGKMKNAILIGTSAIEVGIDFDVPFLVFEAHDVGSFLQRLGRGGRHQPCRAVMFVPQPLADRLAEESSWSFPELVEQSHLALKELPSYAGFLTSSQAYMILLSMALAANRLQMSPYDKRERFDFEAAADFFLVIYEANHHVSLGSVSLRSSLGDTERSRVLSNLKGYIVKVMVRHGFLRGTMNSILARYPASLVGTSFDVYAEIDLFDVFKTEGVVQRAESHWDKMPPALKRRHTGDDPVLVISEISGADYPRIVLSGDALVRNRPVVYREPACHLKHADSHLSTLGQDILDGRNIAFHWRSMNRHTDFRVPRFYVEDEPGGLVIGDWAFVAEYLVKSKMEGESPR